MKKKVAIVGTNGIPAQYGGFETLVENITLYLSNSYDFKIYCSKTQNSRIPYFNNSRLVYVPLKANGWQSIIYDIITLCNAAVTSDIILYLGPGAGFILPIINIFGKKTIINHGGLNEWERKKYSKLERLIAKLGHKIGSTYALHNITDNFVLRQSILKSFKMDSHVIRYGGNHSTKVILNNILIEKYPFLKYEYYVNVSRAQIDNNLHIVLDAFKHNKERNLIMVSNWNISDYGRTLKDEYHNKYSNIILLNAIYDKSEINAIRGNAIAYIHSHSYCGTSPSLVEAMSLGLPIISFDVPTNHETTLDKAIYFKNSLELNEILNTLSKDKLLELSEKMKNIAEKEYTWEKIAKQYSELIGDNY